MIRPLLSPITPELLPGLHALFDECGVPHAKKWEFNPYRSVVAVWKDEVVGFITSWWDGQPIAWVDMLLVTPKYRDHGALGTFGISIATWLWWTMETLLRKEGVKVIRCVLDENSTVAVPLEKAGFSKVGTFLIMERHYSDETQST